MPKYTKTRKQKIMADKRRETSTVSLYSFTSQRSTTQSKTPVAEKTAIHTISTTSYSYLRADLLKTALFTGIIVAAELILTKFLK